MDRKPLLLRLDPLVAELLRAWAADDLRSLNGQIEFLLRAALRDAGRLTTPSSGPAPADLASPRHRSVPTHPGRRGIGRSLEPSAPAAGGRRRGTEVGTTDG